MVLKQLLVFVILIYSSVSFSQDYFSRDQLSQDSLRIEFNAFVKVVESHPIDTNHVAPKLTDNYQLIWVRHVSHSAPYYEKGDMSMLKIDSGKFQMINIDLHYFGGGFSSGVFYGDDYYVLWHNYNTNMSTIFNDVYYYKRKKVISQVDLYAKGAIEWGEPSGPSSGSYLDYSIFTAKIDSSLRIEYNTFSDSISSLTIGVLDTNAIYRLCYYYGTSSGFDLYSDNENYECLYQGNNVVISFKDVQKLIRTGSHGGFSSWVVYGDVLKHTKHFSAHGGTFDIDGQHIYYFEKVE